MKYISENFNLLTDVNNTISGTFFIIKVFQCPSFFNYLLPLWWDDEFWPADMHYCDRALDWKHRFPNEHNERLQSGVAASRCEKDMEMLN